MLVKKRKIDQFEYLGAILKDIDKFAGHKDVTYRRRDGWNSIVELTNSAGSTIRIERGEDEIRVPWSNMKQDIQGFEVTLGQNEERKILGENKHFSSIENKSFLRHLLK